MSDIELGGEGLEVRRVRAASIGKLGASHNRFIPSAAVAHPGDDTNNAATWTEAEGITEVTIIANETTASDAAAYVRVVFDAPNGAVADAWLAEPAFDLDGAVAFAKIPFNERVTFSFTSPLRRVDFEPTDACNILVEAN